MKRETATYRADLPHEFARTRLEEDGRALVVCKVCGCGEGDQLHSRALASAVRQRASSVFITEKGV